MKGAIINCKFENFAFTDYALYALKSPQGLLRITKRTKSCKAAVSFLKSQLHTPFIRNTQRAIQPKN